MPHFPKKSRGRYRIGSVTGAKANPNTLFTSGHFWTLELFKDLMKITIYLSDYHIFKGGRAYWVAQYWEHPPFPLLSSTVPKAQVRVSDHNLSVVRCRCHRCKLFTFSSSPEPLGQNFNQTWHKASLGEWDSSLFKWGTTPFLKGR